MLHPNPHVDDAHTYRAVGARSSSSSSTTTTTTTTTTTNEHNHITTNNTIVGLPLAACDGSGGGLPKTILLYYVGYRIAYSIIVYHIIVCYSVS